MSASATQGGRNEVPTLYRCSASTRVLRCKIPTQHNPVHALDRGADITVTHRRCRRRYVVSFCLKVFDELPSGTVSGQTDAQCGPTESNASLAVRLTSVHRATGCNQSMQTVAA